MIATEALTADEQDQVKGRKYRLAWHCWNCGRNIHTWTRAGETVTCPHCGQKLEGPNAVKRMLGELAELKAERLQGGTRRGRRGVSSSAPAAPSEAQPVRVVVKSSQAAPPAVTEAAATAAPESTAPAASVAAPAAAPASPAGKRGGLWSKFWEGEE